VGQANRSWGTYINIRGNGLNSPRNSSQISGRLVSRSRGACLKIPWTSLVFAWKSSYVPIEVVSNPWMTCIKSPGNLILVYEKLTIYIPRILVSSSGGHVYCPRGANLKILGTKSQIIGGFISSSRSTCPMFLGTCLKSSGIVLNIPVDLSQFPRGLVSSLMGITLSHIRTSFKSPGKIDSSS
jgi:hypothetical protein